MLVVEKKNHLEPLCSLPLSLNQKLSKFYFYLTCKITSEYHKIFYFTCIEHKMNTDIAKMRNYTLYFTYRVDSSTNLDSAGPMAAALVKRDFITFRGLPFLTQAPFVDCIFYSFLRAPRATNFAEYCLQRLNSIISIQDTVLTLVLGACFRKALF